MRKLTFAALALVSGLALADPAPGSVESVTFCTAKSSSSANVALDLRKVWPVGEVEEYPIAYSAVGWDLTVSSAGSVRLYLEGGSLDASGNFTVTGSGTDLVTGLTDKSTWPWLPEGLSKKPYRITHEVTRSGKVQDSETLTAIYDFTNSKATSLEDYRAAALGRTQPLTLTPSGTWLLLGGAGDGIRAKKSGAKLTFVFTGKGTFAFDYAKTGGTLAVTLDGAAETISADAAAWTTKSYVVSTFGTHALVITLSDSMTADIRAAAFSIDGVVARSTSARDPQTLDLRTLFNATSPEDEAFKNFQYAAGGWDIGASDPGAKVTITASPGAIKDGKFVGDGGRELTVAENLEGSGTTNWVVKAASRKVYRLQHAVTKSGSAIADRTLLGYIDLTECRMGATYEDIVAATVLPDSYPVVLVEDPDDGKLWQPVDLKTPYAGFRSAADLANGTETSSGFTFTGIGTFTCEYKLSGGTLAAVVDGGTTNLVVTDTWIPLTFAFATMSDHEISFVHTVASGSQTFVRNVRWSRPYPTVRGKSDPVAIKADLRMGVRTPAYPEELMPFTFSHTNWTGVAGANASSVARVSVVQLSGLGYVPVDLWTNEVAGTRRTVVETAGEATVPCKLKKGVWKAKLEIVTGGSVVHTESAVFDLRKTRYPGFVIIIDGKPSGSSTPSYPTEDIVFEDAGTVYIYDGSRPLTDPTALRWSWKAPDDAALPADYKSAMASSFAETKPLKNGAWIGVTGGNRWAIVDVRTKTAIAWGSAPGSPHTLELLSDGLLAVASTEGSHSVHLYDISGDKATNPSQQNRTAFHTVGDYTFNFPHGLYWDEANKKLWVCGSAGTQTQNDGRLWKCSVSYTGGKFALSVDRQWTTEVGGEMLHDAHDMRLVPGTTQLVMTTVEKVIFFDMANEQWAGDPVETGAAKSCDPSASGKTFLIQVPNHSWLTDVLWLLVYDAQGRSVIYKDFRNQPGADIYKARWIRRLK